MSQPASANPSFDPKTFITLAGEIEQNKTSFTPAVNEARTRTIMSRLYYGLFLNFREQLLTMLDTDGDVNLDNMYKTLYKETEMHGVVIELMKELKPKVGSKLSTLRTERNSADYALSTYNDMTGYWCQVASSLVNAPIPTQDLLDAKRSQVTHILGEWIAIMSRSRRR